uniref:Cysteine-rich receptor-like protein kinase 10 n=1 Tax=Rhizophora mucronata TaxID=61149 RepID=A0A2P2QRR9_RHIMU
MVTKPKCKDSTVVISLPSCPCGTLPYFLLADLLMRQ